MPPDATGGTLQRGVANGNLPAHDAKSANNNVTNHGGPVLPDSKIYYIWWGTTSEWPSDARPGLEALASGLSGSQFLSGTDIFSQYMPNNAIALTSFPSPSMFDSSSPPSHSPSTSTIVSEACNTIKSKGLPPDSTALYVVLASNFPHGANFCAWHSWGTCNGTNIQVAYIPNTTGVSGCDPGNQYACNAYTQGTRSIANVLSHEFSETITDPRGNAWYDSSGQEIGDKCAWTFSSCVALNGLRGSREVAQ